MPLPLLAAYGFTFAAGYGVSTILNQKLSEAPEEGSFFDSINDGVNAVPTVSKYITVSVLAVVVATTVKAITSKS